MVHIIIVATTAATTTTTTHRLKIIVFRGTSGVVVGGGERGPVSGPPCFRLRDHLSHIITLSGTTGKEQQAKRGDLARKERISIYFEVFGGIWSRSRTTVIISWLWTNEEKTHRQQLYNNTTGGGWSFSWRSEKKAKNNSNSTALKITSL